MQAAGGVVLSDSVTTKSVPISVSTGTGFLTVDSGDVLSTTGQILTITANDFNLSGDVSSGTTTTVIECFSAGRTVGLGDTSKDLTISPAEFQKFVATGLTLGGANCGSQTIDGILATNSDNVGGTVTLLASRDDARAISHYHPRS